MNRYPLWKYLLILAALVFGVLYAIPNLYGESPAVQIASIKMDTPAFSHHDEFASVDQVLHRLHRATDVGRCVLDG